jgi:isopentenyldiphosphate isomerase
MPFPQVKSSPYGLRKRRRRLGHLWPESWWKELCEHPCPRRGDPPGCDIPQHCLELIAEFNRRLREWNG